MLRPGAWCLVQKLRKTVRHTDTIGEANPLTGLKDATITLIFIVKYIRSQEHLPYIHGINRLFSAQITHTTREPLCHIQTFPPVSGKKQIYIIRRDEIPQPTEF